MIRDGPEVRWPWGEGHARGTVVERFEHPVEREISGNPVKRNGSPDDPALLIAQKDGQQVLKLRSEVERADEGG